MTHGVFISFFKSVSSSWFHQTLAICRCFQNQMVLIAEKFSADADGDLKVKRRSCCLVLFI